VTDVPPLAQQVSAERASVGAMVEERLGKTPGLVRIADSRAAIYALPGFLSDSECGDLIAQIDATAIPSPLFESNGYEDFRTSSSGNLDRFDPLVAAIDQRLCALLGLGDRHGETIQGQRYHPGQYFRSHADFFFIGEAYWPAMQKVGGQRTWTAMAYLNRPERGGATRFDHLALEVEPEPGMLLVWNNMDANGAPNEWTMHQGCPVEAGTKYIITKWFREGEWFKLPSATL
jgi:prolyl 4-hydroxylase